MRNSTKIGERIAGGLGSLVGIGLLTSVASAQLPSRDLARADSTEPASHSTPVRREKLVDAYRLSAQESLVLDGVLNDALWERVTPISDFTALEPVEGGEPSERTEVRVAFDADNLYIAVRLFDSDPGGIKGFQRKRDQSLATDDRFMWILDTYQDQRNAYFFEINPAGLMGDGLLKTGQGTSLNKAWDGIWRAWVQQDEQGWSAEIRIPFRTLNFDPSSDSWGINFQRTIRRRNEELVWSGALRSQGLLRPQNAGELRGLRGHSQGLGVEVIPFTLANQPVRGQRASATSPSTRMGADLNYSITPNLRAGLTINTDFAETEVDDRQVNLSRFPIVFPERRAFFLEGASVFSFAPASGPNPFFSRRIGLAGGAPVPVRGGARIIGRVGRQDVGLLHLGTGDRADGGARESFTVARVSRNLFRESSVGLLYTRRSTEGDTLDDRHTIGVDMELSTSRFLTSRNLQFQAFAVVHSDATPSQSQLPPLSWQARSARGLRVNFPNRPWDAHVSVREFGDAYDPAVGFVPRVGFRRVQPSVSWTPLVPRSRVLRELTFEYFNEYLTDLQWRPQTVNHRIIPLGVRFESGDAITTQLLWNFEALDQPFDILRDSRFVVPVGDYQNRGFRLQASTASFRRVSGTASFQRRGFWTGSRDDVSADVTVRPIAGINVTANWIYNTVTLPDGGFDAQVYRLFSSVDMSPFVSLNVNVQYDNVSRLLGTQNRLVWTLTPGNTMFVVYQHNWLTPVDQRLQSLEGLATLKLSVTQRF